MNNARVTRNLNEQNMSNVSTEIASPVKEVVKSQVVRIADVLLIGPLMIFAGWMLAEYRLSKVNRPLGWIIVGIGVSTILYNGRNYLRNEKRLNPPDRLRRRRREKNNDSVQGVQAIDRETES